MENNQHKSGTKNTSATVAAIDSANEQLPQHVPVQNEAGKNSSQSNDTNAVAEQHSESSKPEAANETLGTP